MSDLMVIEIEGIGYYTYSSDDLGGFSDDDGDGIFTLSSEEGQTVVGGPEGYQFELSDWSITVDQDPFVSQAFGFTNLGATAVFTITVSIPALPIGPSSLMGGSTGGSTTDADNSGAGGISTAVPAPLFTGLIDGAPVLPLHPDPFSLSFVFGGQTLSIPVATAGLPGPTLPGPAVGVSIGIENKFSLTGGDSIAMTNFFIVEPVPEPSTVVLLMIGSLALFGSTRRRKN